MRSYRIIICVIIGLIFIVGGIAKLFPISTFEFQLVRDNLLAWTLAPVFSRLLIGFEILLGVNLLFQRNLRSLTIPLSFLTLFIFCLYLVFVIAVKGIQSNCGCYGELIPLNTLQSLMKNILLMALLGISYFMSKRENKIDYFTPLISVVVIYAALFFLFPMTKYQAIQASQNDAPSRIQDSIHIEQTINTDDRIDSVNTQKTPVRDSMIIRTVHTPSRSIFHSFTRYSSGDENPDQGEKIIAVMSLDCEHCLRAAKLLAQSGRIKRLPKILALFLGEDSKVESFFTDAGTRFAYRIIPPEQFFPLLKKTTPRICYMINGNIIAEWEEDEFTREKLESAIKNAHQKAN